MTVDLEQALQGVLGDSAEVTLEEMEGLLSESTGKAWTAIEGSFARAGWYSGSTPYPPPVVPVDAIPPASPTVVEAERRLWLARYNPSDPDFESDIADDRQFPWPHPEAAVKEGWWLSTRSTPAQRQAIEELSTGDLIVCQRSDPGTRDSSDPYQDSTLVGVCVVGLKDSWQDAISRRREHRACLVPLAKFTYPVPRTTARRHHRLGGDSFSKPRQLPGRNGPLGFTLSAVDWDDAVDLLSVCGIAPEALSQADTAELAARLRASDTGNKLFLRLRYDAVLRDKVRRVHERQAERRAERWAAANGYVKRDDYPHHVPLAGFDLLFVDRNGTELQLEVKGYAARSLARVHLQPSQVTRAANAARGAPPGWRLFALLGTGSKAPVEKVLTPQEVVVLLASGGIQARR